jgi:hypothetical protein
MLLRNEMEVAVRFWSVLAAGIGLGLSTSSAAQTLEYNWTPGELLQYRVQAYVKAPRILRFYASENLDARVVELTMGLELDCTPEEPGRRSQGWVCDIHRIQLGGMAFEGEQDKLNRIFVEYTDILSNAEVQLEWTPQGRIKTVDLEGFSKRNDREQVRYEYLRLLIQRAVSALELELPKSGDASKKWRQKGSPLVLRLPTRFGTAGGVRLEHEVSVDNGTQVGIQSVGRGTVSSGQSLEAGVDNAVSLSSLGQATFDVESGVLLRNELNVQGALNTSSSGATDGFYLSQFVLVEKVDGWEEPAVEQQEEAAAPAEQVDEEAADSGASEGSEEEQAAEEAPAGESSEVPSAE